MNCQQILANNICRSNRKSSVDVISCVSHYFVSFQNYLSCTHFCVSVCELIETYIPQTVMFNLAQYFIDFCLNV